MKTSGLLWYSGKETMFLDFVNYRPYHSVDVFLVCAHEED